ncbi:MAG: helix-turn-helix transcriptional regulator [Anaerolineales bacterium]|jgi:DNA-binding PadR family transcriptional regulator|nr:helix-turn-helix transcriptional regulator [Anaerolineales bacterium]
MNTSTDIQTQLPLTEVTYFILLSLAPEPRHGYAIMKDVERLSQGRVFLSTGTLYGALKRLLELGWIVRTQDSKESENNRERKAYSLTNLGQSILQAEIERLSSLLDAASIKRLGNSKVIYPNQTNH